MNGKREFKSQRTVSGGAGSYRKWAEWTEGDYVVGKFVGFQEDKTYNKQHTKIKVEEASWDKALVGKTLILNSNGMLDKAMENVDEGQFVQVTYNGEGMIEKGPFKGKMAHSVAVEVGEISAEEDDGL